MPSFYLFFLAWILLTNCHISFQSRFKMICRLFVGTNIHHRHMNVQWAFWFAIDTNWNNSDAVRNAKTKNITTFNICNFVLILFLALTFAPSLFVFSRRSLSPSLLPSLLPFLLPSLLPFLFLFLCNYPNFSYAIAKSKLKLRNKSRG